MPECRCQNADARMPMPAASTSMPMPSYDGDTTFTIQNTHIPYCIGPRLNKKNEIFFPKFLAHFSRFFPEVPSSLFQVVFDNVKRRRNSQAWAPFLRLIAHLGRYVSVSPSSLYFRLSLKIYIWNKNFHSLIKINFHHKKQVLQAFYNFRE